MCQIEFSSRRPRKGQKKYPNNKPLYSYKPISLCFLCSVEKAARNWQKVEETLKHQFHALLNSKSPRRTGQNF